MKYRFTGRHIEQESTGEKADIIIGTNGKCYVATLTCWYVQDNFYGTETPNQIFQRRSINTNKVIGEVPVMDMIDINSSVNTKFKNYKNVY